MYAALGIALLTFILPIAGQAQSFQAQPFETVAIRVGGTANVYENFLHVFWERGVGGEASVATPFYLGYVEAGGAFHRYGVVQPTVPAFDAVLVFAGWGLRLDLAERLWIEAGPRIGTYRMTFDEVTFTGVKNESELMLGVGARASLRLAGPLAVHAGGSYQKVYTFVRLNLWYATAGLSYRLRSPEWLKDVLR